MITRYSSHALANDLHPELLTLRLIVPTEDFFLGSSSIRGVQDNSRVALKGEQMNCDRAAGIGRNGSSLNPLRGFFPALLAATLVFVFSIPASAQRHDGTLRVIVPHVSGAGVLDAKVTVTNEATNVSASTTASSEGTYVFPSLLVGSYTVTIEK